MVRTFLVRGMVVGIVAGLLSFGFLKVFGEPQVDRAVAFETQQDEAKAAAHKADGHMHMSDPAADHASDADEPELVSRSVQAGLGLFVAVLVYSAAFGGLFGLAYAFAYGRIPGVLSPQALSIVLAVTGFIAVYLVPNLKYPANREPETIGVRTALYFAMIAISFGAMAGSIAFRRLFVARFGDWNATLIAGAYYIALMTAVALVLPAVNEVPDQFPAVVLWNFRIASVGAQLIMWATLGMLFGALTQRAARNGQPRA
jgi:hypothetical protein